MITTRKRIMLQHRGENVIRTMADLPLYVNGIATTPKAIE
jgi:hypothetical protein